MTEERMKSSVQTMMDQIETLSLAEGFFQSSVIFALLKLGVFESIGETVKHVDRIASELGLQSPGLSRLLNAGVVLKILESKDGLDYSLSSRSRGVLLKCARQNYLGDWIRNLDFFRFALERLDEVLINSKPIVDPSEYLKVDEKKAREFTLAMHNYASLRGKELANFLDTSKCKTLLDLGCGPGTYAFHLGMKNANLELWLVDTVSVLEVAKEVREEYLLSNKIEFLPLDVTEEKIPGTFDVILVSNTLHMLGEEASCGLIRRLYNSVSPGGSLVIQGQFLKDDRMGDRWAIFLDLIQLCTTVNGRNHTVKETRRWMEEAGFQDIEFCAMTLLNTNKFLRGYKK